MSDECNVEGDGLVRNKQYPPLPPVRTLEIYEEEKGRIRLTYSFSSYCRMGRDG